MLLPVILNISTPRFPGSLQISFQSTTSGLMINIYLYPVFGIAKRFQISILSRDFGLLSLEENLVFLKSNLIFLQIFIDISVQYKYKIFGLLCLTQNLVFHKRNLVFLYIGIQRYSKKFQLYFDTEISYHFSLQKFCVLLQRRLKIIIKF